MLRPLLKPTLVMLPMFAVLAGLGLWQLERLQWKQSLIAQIDKNLTAPPLTLDEILTLPETDAQYRRVTLTGRFDHAKESYVFTTGEGGKPDYHVLTPLLLETGRALMVDRGMVPETARDPSTREQGQLPGTQTLTGIWRTPDAPNAFTPKPDRAKRIWFSRNVKAMAAEDGLRLAAPVLVEADATPNPGGWPKGGQTVIAIPNNHLQYAVTWLLLAAGLVVVYLVYHRQKGRL